MAQVCLQKRLARHLPAHQTERFPTSLDIGIFMVKQCHFRLCGATAIRRGHLFRSFSQVTWGVLRNCHGIREFLSVRNDFRDVVMPARELRTASRPVPKAQNPPTMSGSASRAAGRRLSLNRCDCDIGPAGTGERPAAPIVPQTVPGERQRRCSRGDSQHPRLGINSDCASIPDWQPYRRASNRARGRRGLPRGSRLCHLAGLSPLIPEHASERPSLLDGWPLIE